MSLVVKKIHIIIKSVQSIQLCKVIMHLQRADPVSPYIVHLLYILNMQHFVNVC